MLAIATPTFAQNGCLLDAKIARLNVDFQTASLICPKWNPITRADFAYMLLQTGTLPGDALLKAEKPGLVRFREPCATEIADLEGQSFKEARAKGTDTFCLDISVWLTVPNVRYGLEQNGAFGVAK